MRHKLFDIEYAFINRSRIVAGCQFPKMEEVLEVVILKKDFEKWLDKSGRLDEVFDYVDHNGEHYQEERTISLETYWEGNMNFEDDVYDYIISKSTTDPFFDTQKAINQIVSEFKLKN